MQTPMLPTWKRVAALRPWARRLRATPEPGQVAPAGRDLIYRLKSWPQLDEAARTARIYRLLSVMSSRPVNRLWIERHLGMAPEEINRLLQRLAECGALQVIDPADFPRLESPAGDS
jgi:hypothetical protein